MKESDERILFVGWQNVDSKSNRISYRVVVPVRKMPTMIRSRPTVVGSLLWMTVRSQATLTLTSVKCCVVESRSNESLAAPRSEQVQKVCAAAYLSLFCTVDKE